MPKVSKTMYKVSYSSHLPPCSDITEQLNVGVGALAGSTIMVLIIPWYLSIVGGRVNIDPKTGKPSYKAPKLDPPNFFHLTETGVAISPEVNQTAYLMLLTTLSYFLLQVPGLVYLSSTPAEQAAGEQNWALFGGILCVTFFSYYLYLQYKKSNADAGIQQDSRDEYLRTAIANKTVTLAGVMTIELEKYLEEGGRHRSLSNSSYQSGSSVTGATTEMAPLTRQSSSIEISDRFVERLKRVLKPFFASYDVDGNGCLKMQDLSAVFRDMGEQLTIEELDNNFAEFDSDHNGTIDYNEFVRGTAKYIATHKDVPRRYKQTRTHSMHNAHYKALEEQPIEEQPIEEEDEDEEEEEVPDDIKMLSPEEQQVQIKRRAFWMMAVGSAIVLLISDPMVEVLSEIGARTGIPSFYVAFVVAPLASNATELIAAYNYAQKKTATSITVSLTTLEGAAIMNNTFVLGKGIYVEAY